MTLHTSQRRIVHTFRFPSGFFVGLMLGLAVGLIIMLL